MSFLRLWLIGTAIVVALLAVWAFAPILIFVVLLTIGLGLLSALMVVLARALEAWRARRRGGGS